MERPTINFSVLLAAIGAMALMGCQKNQLEQPMNPEAVNVTPKVPPFFIGCDGPTQFNYKVYKWYSNCVEYYGDMMPNPRCEAPDNMVIFNPIGQANVVRVVQTASCNVDIASCRLLTGPNLTNNVWGPWYYIWPLAGPSILTRKGLKVRLKRVVAPLDNSYNAGFRYDPTSNTWHTAGAVASGNFQVEVLTGLGNLCAIRQ